MQIYNRRYESRLMVGTAQYPSPIVLQNALRAAEPALVTVSLRREAAADKAGAAFWSLINELGFDVLPNTAGCYSVKEAVTTAQMAREVFGTNLIKLEVIADAQTLQPDVYGLVEAAEILCRDGFEVLPYTTEDLSVCERLVQCGCSVLMPWGAPIGSGLGLNNRHGLQALRNRFPDLTLIVDAGLGVPSHASAAMELGYDGVLLNTAIARAADPAAMASAFALAVKAGRLAFEAGAIEPRNLAQASTPVLGRAFT
ncbi:thiazole synthase [Aureimonas fodinaquatilis]|uniref:Thiazole synthase n=1 Tax=Aureimonas fodinaquatilis TaxID=2565783 RepID=A0A5B0E331_9HYPH|nr:thiazole synthase [Aureimonas fodinaquatilis]KAA0972555.1 thiazole synthase [Aureimonas fodinaquatilis]